MSKITLALEAQVALILANRPTKDIPQTARQRANTNRAYAAILKLIAPRIRHFVRQYGLTAHWEDAEQACAIAVHRSIETYDPAKAQFTTLVNWQIRGELQSLRFRLMTDQRSSARKVGAVTVPLDARVSMPDGEEFDAASMIADEDALERVEAGASDFLANAATESLVDAYVAHLRTLGIEKLKKNARTRKSVRREPISAAASSAPRAPAFRGVDAADLAQLEGTLLRNRRIVTRRLFENASLDELCTDHDLTKERVRQITKRATRIFSELTHSHPRFAVMSSTAPIQLPARTPKAVPQPLPSSHPAIAPGAPAANNNPALVFAAQTSAAVH